jgi:hypothetical protein
VSHFALIVMVAMLVLTGCGSTISSSVTLVPSPVNTGQLLMEAGFQKRLANTPQRAAHLQTLPQGQIMPIERHGQITYLYADAANCNCLYVGNQQAYQRYRQLAAQRTDVYNPLGASSGSSAPVPSMDWGLWEEMQGAE